MKRDLDSPSSFHGFIDDVSLLAAIRSFPSWPKSGLLFALSATSSSFSKNRGSSSASENRT
jgi:hypothetical protein